MGKVVIPLLRIHNGEKRWYTLKDKTMNTRAKGNSPQVSIDIENSGRQFRQLNDSFYQQILLEMFLTWSPLRAAIRALEPKEEKLVQQEAKFKRQLFLRNVTRLKIVVCLVLDWCRYIQYVIFHTKCMTMGQP